MYRSEYSTYRAASARWGEDVFGWHWVERMSWHEVESHGWDGLRERGEYAANGRR